MIVAYLPSQFDKLDISSSSQQEGARDSRMEVTVEVDGKQSDPHHLDLSAIQAMVFLPAGEKNRSRKAK